MHCPWSQKLNLHLPLHTALPITSSYILSIRRTHILALVNLCDPFLAHSAPHCFSYTAFPAIPWTHTHTFHYHCTYRYLFLETSLSVICLVCSLPSFRSLPTSQFLHEPFSVYNHIYQCHPSLLSHLLFFIAYSLFILFMGSSWTDRNGMDLTEAADIKKRWQESTEELYKKTIVTQITTMVWSLT